MFIMCCRDSVVKAAKWGKTGVLFASAQRATAFSGVLSKYIRIPTLYASELIK